MAHTPGPWVYHIGSEYWWVILEKRGDLFPVKEIASVWAGDVNNPSEHAEDNARLIAAAPVMLEALKAARRDIIEKELAWQFIPVLTMIDAAIAKATGEAATEPDICPDCGSDLGHRVNCPRGIAFTRERE